MNTCQSWPLRRFIILIPFIIGPLAVNAQHLPGVQKGGLRAPVNIKTDGKATEWKNKFQAFNNATEVFYTIANDDNNLYLAVQADKPAVINKIIRGGITLTVNHSTSKSDKQPALITFPILDNSKDGTAIIQSINKKANDNPDTARVRKQTDSLTAATNKLLIEKLKKIKVLGIKPIIDTFISIYNEEAIEGAALVDHKRALNVEIAIPLKYLGLSVDNTKPFAYNVKLNAASSGGTTTINRDRNGNISSIMVVTVSVGAYSQNSAYDTDFWGEYSLKK